MRIGLMRHIDRWLGGFLVMVLSVPAAWRQSTPVLHDTGFGPNPPGAGDREASVPAPDRPVRADGRPLILVSKYFGLGSIVLSVPFLRQIRQRFPSARLVFMSFASNRELLTFLPYVDDVVCIDTSLRRFPWDVLRTVWRLRRAKVDLCFDLEFFSRFSALMSFFIGSPTRVGFHTSSLPARGRLLTHRVHWNPFRHASENFMALGGCVGIPPGEADLALRALSADEQQRVSAWLREQQLTEPFVVCSPQADTLEQLKAYPPERWRELADAVHQRTGYQVVFVGSQQDPTWNPRTDREAAYLHNLGGRTSLTTLMGLLKRAACVIGVDSGVPHLGAALGVPTLTLFGPETPELYGTLNPLGDVVYAGLHCSPCVNLLEGKQSDCRSNVCISRWPASELCDRAIALMDSAASRGEPATG